jgi:hypothetical protein
MSIPIRTRTYFAINNTNAIKMGQLTNISANRALYRITI